MSTKDKLIKCNNFSDMIQLLIRTYKKYKTPWHSRKPKKESSNLITYLRKINRLGGLTTDSQLGLVEHKTGNHEFYVQKAHVDFIIDKKKSHETISQNEE